MTKDIRERFEKWVLEGDLPAPVLERDSAGEYTFLAIKMEWNAWQAATEDMQGEIDKLEEMAINLAQKTMSFRILHEMGMPECEEALIDMIAAEKIVLEALGND